MRYKIKYNCSTKDFSDIWKIENDYLQSSSISSVEQVKSWYIKNKDIHVFVKDNLKNKIVGEITILPLNEEQFNKFMKNELEDTEINSSDILNYEDNESYYLLFSTIAIDKAYRNDKIILSLLLKGLYDKMIYFKSRNISFKNMCAEGQTKDGQKFIESFLNLNYNCDTKDGYKLYSYNSGQAFENWLINLPKYIDVYNKKFNLDY